VPYKFEGVLQPGKHHIPFKFMLRSGIPSSVNLSTKSEKIRVKYQIKALVSDKTGQVPPIKGNCPFLVTELP
jgi:hypothetical protein